MTSTPYADVRSLLEKEGPFVSLYLGTEGARADAEDELELRWRSLRQQALGEGASESALDAIGDVIDGAYKKGDGLAVFTAGDQIVLRRYLSRPVPDSITVGSTPGVLRLLEWQQDNPRYAVVLTDRQGGEIHIISGHETEDTTEVEGSDDWPIQKVAPGGWSQRRFQNRAENSWEANAKTVVDELTKIVSAEDIDFVVIAGDVRAIQFLKEHLPQEIAATAFELTTEPHQLEDIREELDKTAATWVGQKVEETLQKFQEERGQNDLAVEGKQATFEALRKAQVERLLISPERLDDIAYFSRGDLTQTALDRKELAELGMTDIEEASASDVLVRAAIGTGARVVVIPELGKQHGPREGVGALLRYAD